ncbi:hypothetical protein [Arcanobacterium phocae]|uniref:hypothetical protein n=1 Tax=Arcanobacterium phocae TaxID=131112 RepID=UPI001C1203C8|nr:hypothetical protein [Arcanobacterium phocae]
MPADQEDVRELVEGLSPFPEGVFVPDQPWLTNYFLPLISIDLGLLVEELRGTVVHMLNPFEPYDGLIGEDTAQFHTEFCGENWLAFELTPDNKYRFLASEDYFLSSPTHGDDDEDMAEVIEEMKAIYQRSRDRFHTTGKLLPWQESNPQAFMDVLGGEISYGNWSETSPVPPAFEMTIDPADGLPNNGISLSYQGREFLYVGEVAGYNYCGSGADAILLFFEPKSRIALFTYDWS